jgi:short-subunit dehydrogenase
MRIDGKTVLITGASSGIGAATAAALARRGARVLLVARSADKLRSVADAIRSAGGSAEVLPADLSDPAAVAGIADEVRDRCGVPDILINNAGAGRWLSVVETSPQQARQMIELPYLAAFYMTRAFLPDMLARQNGVVLNVTSVASFMVWPNAAAYIAARHALKGFTEALRTEVKKAGISVSLVTLGPVESTYWEHNPGSRERVPRGTKTMSTEEAARTIVATIEREKPRVTRPGLFRLLFAMEALFRDFPPAIALDLAPHGHVTAAA